MSENGVLVNFGDVFNYNNDEFVYLAENAEKKIVYAARILNEPNTETLLNHYQKIEYKPSTAHNSLVFSFVVLDTEAFRNRVAWFKDTGRDGSRVSKPYQALNESDLDKIKREILEGPFPEDLKEKIQKTTD